jgi:hypothetical protein
MSGLSGIIKPNWVGRATGYEDATFGPRDNSWSTNPRDIMTLSSWDDNGKIHWDRLPSVLSRMKGMSEKEYRQSYYTLFPKQDDSSSSRSPPFILETFEQPPSSLLSQLELHPSEKQFVSDWLSLPIYALQLHDRLRKNMIDYDLHKGVFVVLLTEMLERRVVIVDDYIPYLVRDGRIVPLCTITSTKNSAFVTIFEKAIAKLRGSYRDILRYDAGHGMLYLNQYSQTAIILQINRKDQQWNLLRKILEPSPTRNIDVKQSSLPLLQQQQQQQRLVVFTLCYRIDEFNQTGDAGSHNYLALAMCDIHPQSEGPTGDEYADPPSSGGHYDEEWTMAPGDVSYHSVTCFALKCVSGGREIPSSLRLHKSKAYLKYCGYLDKALHEALNRFYRIDTSTKSDFPQPHERFDREHLDGIFWITWPEINRYMGAYFIVDLIDDARYQHYYAHLPPISREHWG